MPKHALLREAMASALSLRFTKEVEEGGNPLGRSSLGREEVPGVIIMLQQPLPVPSLFNMEESLYFTALERSKKKMIGKVLAADATKSVFSAVDDGCARRAFEVVALNQSRPVKPGDQVVVVWCKISNIPCHRIDITRHKIEKLQEIWRASCWDWWRWEALFLSIAELTRNEFTPTRMLEEKRKEHFQAVRMLAMTTVLWGLSFPVVKSIGLIQESLVPGVSSWFHAGLTGFVRFAAAALVLAALTWKTLRNLTWLELWQGGGLGLFAAGGILFQMDGLSYTSASTSAFLTQSFCVLVPIIVAIRDREFPGWHLVVAIMMVMGGVAVLSKFDLETFHLGRGEFETLVSTIFFAAQIVWLERGIFSGTNANHFSIIMFVAMAFISAPIVVATWKTPLDPLKCYSNGGVVILNAALIIFCTIGAFVFMNKWQPLVPATEASIIYGAEPLFASFLALFLPGIISQFTGIQYPNEKVTWEMLVGGALILGANLFLQARWMHERRSGDALQ